MDDDAELEAIHTVYEAVQVMVENAQCMLDVGKDPFDWTTYRATLPGVIVAFALKDTLDPIAKSLADIALSLAWLAQVPSKED